MFSLMLRIPNPIILQLDSLSGIADDIHPIAYPIVIINDHNTSSIHVPIVILHSTIVNSSLSKTIYILILQ